MATASLRDRIAAAKDAQTVAVNVPEWDCTVVVHSLTTQERIQWELDCSKKKKEKVTVDPFKLRSALLIATCHCPDTGEKVFTADDHEMLGGKNSAVTERLFNVAAKLSGISEQDEADIAGK